MTLASGAMVFASKGDLPVTIGRATSNSLVIESAAVSAQHCRLERRPAGVFFIDHRFLARFFFFFFFFHRSSSLCCSTNGSSAGGVLVNNAEVQLTQRETEIKLAPSKGTKTVVLRATLGESNGPPGARLKRAKTDIPSTLGTDDESPKKTTAAAVAVKDDQMKSSFMCAICQSVFYQPVSLMPCLHSFCAGCYAAWEAKCHGSPDCPSCRMPVKNVQIHHQLKSLAEAYVQEHPEERRPDEEIREMDAQFEPLRKRLAEKQKKKSRRGSDGEDNDDDEDDDDDDDDEGGGAGGGHQGGGFANFLLGNLGNPFAFHAAAAPMPVVAMQPPAPLRCRECDVPNASDGYLCPMVPSHTTCFLCHRLMPNRDLASIKCAGCLRPSCGVYMDTACKSHFKKVSDFVSFQHQNGPFLLDNPYETAILVNYLNSKQIPLNTFASAVLVPRLGNLQCESFPNVTPDSYLCSMCYNKMVCELAYAYRKEIPAADLPQAVAQRPDCHWGYKCRTQQHNAGHAQRFNHICAQTRNA